MDFGYQDSAGDEDHETVMPPRSSVNEIVTIICVEREYVHEMPEKLSLGMFKLCVNTTPFNK